MDLKKASAEEMRKSVYANYADFIRLVEFRLETMISRSCFACIRLSSLISCTLITTETLGFVSHLRCIVAIHASETGMWS